MAKVHGLWGKEFTSGLRLSIESAMDTGNEDTVLDAMTGDEVSYNEEFAKLVMEAAEIEADVAALQRANTAVDTGENIADIADSIEQRPEGATPEEAALLQSGVAQTLDATGAPDEVVDEVTQQVATESEGRIKLSTEGFKEILASMWQRTKEFVANIINNITNLWNRFFNSTAGVIKDAKAIQKDLSNYDALVTPEKLTSWNSSFENLSVDSKMFSTAAALKETLTLKTLCGEVGGNVTTAINEVITLCGLLNKNSTKGDVIDLCTGALKKLSGNKAATLEELGKEYIGDRQSLRFGNKFLYTGYNKDYAAEKGQEVSLLNSFKCKVSAPDAKVKIKPESFNDNALTVKQVETVCDDVIAAMETLSKFYNEGSKKAKKEIDKLKDDISNAVNSIKESDDLNVKSVVKVIQRTYYLPTQILQGNVSVCVHYTKVAKAYLALCRASLAKNKKMGSK